MAIIIYVPITYKHFGIGDLYIGYTQIFPVFSGFPGEHIPKHKMSIYSAKGRYLKCS